MLVAADFIIFQGDQYVLLVGFFNIYSSNKNPATVVVATQNSIGSTVNIFKLGDTRNFNAREKLIVYSFEWMFKGFLNWKSIPIYKLVLVGAGDGIVGVRSQ